MRRLIRTIRSDTTACSGGMINLAGVLEGGIPGLLLSDVDAARGWFIRAKEKALAAGDYSIASQANVGLQRVTQPSLLWTLD